MKWAKTKKQYVAIYNRLKKELDKKSLAKEMDYYDLIKDVSTLTDLEDMGFGTWLEVPKLDKQYKRRNAKTRYEIFVGGYLYYFDKHVKESEFLDRTLYFDWGVINKERPLTIFLKPFFGNPLKTETVNANSDITSNGNGNGNGNGKGNGKYNGFVKKPEKFDVLTNTIGGKMHRTAIAPPPAAPIDPPPPDPPPPPTR